MFNVKVLGSGCANCESTYALINEVCETNGIPLELEKIEDIDRKSVV